MSLNVNLLHNTGSKITNTFACRIVYIIHNSGKTFKSLHIQLTMSGSLEHAFNYAYNVMNH